MATHSSQYSCLENPTDRGACCPWGCKESDTTEQLHSLTQVHRGKELYLPIFIEPKFVFYHSNQKSATRSIHA